METKDKAPPLNSAGPLQPAAWMKQLEEKGWCVVPKVLPADAVKKLVTGFGAWLAGFKTGIDLDNPATWTTKNWPPNMHGIMQQLYIGHQQFVWDARQDPRCVQPFLDWWSTRKRNNSSSETKQLAAENMLVSFDGACASFPAKRAEKPWPHVDQGSASSALECVQGFINLQPCGPDQGGLVVYEGSHLLHGRFWESSGKRTTKGEDWYRFSTDEMKQFYGDCKRHKVCCEPGDIVLWDSRTVHHGEKPAPRSTTTTPRMVIYLCYTPREWASEAMLQRKREVLLNLRMTSHWPHKTKTFGLIPRIYSLNDKQRLWEQFIAPAEQKRRRPQLSALGARLAGFESETDLAQQVARHQLPPPKQMPPDKRKSPPPSSSGVDDSHTAGPPPSKKRRVA